MLGEILSWCFAILSNITWLCVYISQLKENYINKSNFNLSFYFIFCWFISDTLSNYSGYYKGSPIIILYISSCNTIFDTIFICQYFYYKFHDSFNLDNYEPLLEDRDRNINKTQIIFKTIFDILKTIEIQLLLIYIFFIISIDVIINITHIEKVIIGQIYGWVLCTVLILARLSQMMFNYNKENIKKSSGFIFISIICANLFLLTSILLRLIDINDNNKLEYINKNIQWVITPIITSLLDFIIIYNNYT
jgi:hypothetical protein